MKASVTLLIPPVLVMRSALRASIDALPNGLRVSACGGAPLLPNGHKRTKNSSESCQSVALFNFFLIMRFALRLHFVCTFAFLFLGCDAYTEPIQTRSGLIDARYLCRPSCAARVESRAEIGELGGSDCFNSTIKQNQCYPQWIGTPSGLELGYSYASALCNTFWQSTVLVHHGSTTTTTTHHHHDHHRNPRPTSRSSTRSCCCS